MSAAASRVLVTGGSGYIAGVLIRQLLANGWQVNTAMSGVRRWWLSTSANQ